MPAAPDTIETEDALIAARDAIAASIEGYRPPVAFAVGLATHSEAGERLDTWFPHVNGDSDSLSAAVLARVSGYRSTTGSHDLSDADLAAAIADLSPAEGLRDRAHPNLDALRAIRATVGTPLSGGRTRRAVVSFVASHDDAPADLSDAYLRLHLLSHRVIQPHGTSLDGLFGTLANAVWTTDGPFAIDGFALTRARAEAEGTKVTVNGIDKFPRMLDYVVPRGVRIADGSRVRLGAHLAEGTVVMHEGFCNFNAGTLGQAMVEGRISAGVVVAPESDIGGGASIQGTLSGGGTEVISIGSGCLIGANGGVGISLGNGCTVEAGLYVTAGTRVTTEDGSVVKARELSGAENLLFRRNSTSGAVEAIAQKVAWGGLNQDLH